ncbi:MAG: serine/threonine-protein kinase, partial [Myxococcota bacterium]
MHLRAREMGERIPYTLVAFILAETAEALAHAHALRNSAGELENLVHRDVSPQNILVSYDGVPKLIDFGVARAKSRAAQTKVGIVKGKFAYMSPEQAMAKELDGRSDIWALGVVLYQLISRELPFRGSSDIDTLRRVVAGQLTPIQEVAPDTPKPLVDIIERAMQSDRDVRYQSASEGAADCREFVSRSKRTVDSRLLAAYMR